MNTKTILTLSFAFCLFAMAKAQPEPGTFSITPRVGVSANKFTGDSDIELYCISQPTYDSYRSLRIGSVTSRALTKTQYKIGYTADLDCQWQLSRRWALVSGIGYSLQGCGYKTDSYHPVYDASAYDHLSWDIKDVRFELHFLNVPVMAKFYAYKGLALNAGLQAGWLMQSYLKAHAGFCYNVTGDYYLSFVDDIRHFDAGRLYETDAESKKDKNFHRFQMAIPVGLSYEYKNFVTDARFNFGWTDLSDAGGYVRNISFALSVGYRFDIVKR